MISLYRSFETDFTHNGIVINALSCEVEEVANGLNEVSLDTTLEYSEMIVEGNILKVPTPNGEQLYRIYEVEKTLEGINIAGEHIFYDLKGNWLEDVRPTNLNGEKALNYVLERTRFPHRFKGYSDISALNTSYFIRKNVVEGIIGAENSIINNWNAFLVRDNFDIYLLKDGVDNNYEIRYGKNLTGLKVEINTSEIVTSIHPTRMQDNNTVLTIPEKYINSTRINDYPYPRVEELRVNITEEEKDLPVSQLNEILRTRARERFEKEQVDIPKITIDVDFVDLSRIEEYKKFEFLQNIKMHEYVHVFVDKDNLKFEAKSQVVKYRYDCLSGKYISLTLGNHKQNLSSLRLATAELKKEVAAMKGKGGSVDVKNSTFTSVEEPTALAIGDLWYQPTNNGQESYKNIYQWDGTKWIYLSNTSINKNSGTIQSANKDIDINLDNGEMNLGNKLVWTNGDLNISPDVINGNVYNSSYYTAYKLGDMISVVIKPPVSIKTIASSRLPEGFRPKGDRILSVSYHNSTKSIAIWNIAVTDQGYINIDFTTIENTGAIVTNRIDSTIQKVINFTFMK